jgi:hypothetical protein
MIAGGFGSFLLGLDKKTYELSGVSTPGNVPGSYKDPGIGWMIGFLLAVSFVGLLTLLPLRKVRTIPFPGSLCPSLIFPSPTSQRLPVDLSRTSCIFSGWVLLAATVGKVLNFWHHLEDRSISATIVFSCSHLSSYRCSADIT